MADKFDYLEAKADADELISEFGFAAVLRRETPGTGPAQDPGSPTITDYAVTVVELDYSTHEIDGARILVTDKKIFMAVGDLSITPDSNTDKIIAGGLIYTLVSPVKPLAPGGVTIFYELQCRGGEVFADYVPSLDFSIAANSQYISAIAA
jgi:hypothetical protein